MNDFNFHWHGLSCLEIAVDRPLRPTLFRRLALAAKRLREADLADGATSSYGSLAAYWRSPPGDSVAVAGSIASVLRECLSADEAELAAKSARHLVDVRYSGPDLNDLARYCDLDSSEVIRRHSEPDYVVAAVGFLPHFGYLWGLDPALAMGRRDSPRVRVPAGAVGIAGEQTGIYPQESPGGWQLIGEVNPDQCREVCQRFRVGDVVQFQAVQS